MSEPFITPVGYKTKKIILLIASILGTALVVAIVWGGIVFSNYRNSGGAAPVSSAPAMISIGTPADGDLIKMGESVIVEASAVGPNPFLSIELWLDGELAGVQAAPTGGMHPFNTHFSWQPASLGLHSLIVAAVNQNGEKTLSSQVVVMVVENEDGIEINPPEDVSEVLPAPPEGYVPPAGPGGAAVWPAGNWAGTLGDWATSLNEDEKPDAPELVVEEGQCLAELQIHDLSNNEEGFVVYRQTVNSPAWLKVATLSSQSNVEWIVYQDVGVFGAVTYYVTAFNVNGDAESNLALVNITPEPCDGGDSGISATEVDLTLQIPEVGAEKVYCYQSPYGIHWERWPHFGFLTPNEEGVLPKGVLQVQESNELSHGLFMECWGWQGDVLVPLGSFSEGELKPDLTNKQIIVGEGLSALVEVQPLKILGLGDLFPMGAGAIADFQLNPLDFSTQKLTPIAPTIPSMILSLTTDREICGNWLPPDAQNPLGALIYCFPYPELDVDKGATTPQSYLTWALPSIPKCSGGFSEECLSYPQLLALAEGNGGQVGFEVIAISSKGNHRWTLTEPYLQMFVAPPITCLGDMQNLVRMWYQPGNKGTSVMVEQGGEMTEIDEFKMLPPNKIFYGPYSNIVSVPCLPYEMNVGGIVTTKRQYLDVTFETMELLDVDDDDGDITGFGEEIEVYGHFEVYAPSMGQLTNPPCILNDFPGACDTPPGPFGDSYIADRNRYSLIHGWEKGNKDSCYSCNPKEFGGKSTYEEYCAGCSPVLPSGYYELKDWLLCQSTNQYGCHYEGQDTSYKTNNNTIRVFVTEGDSLTFGVNMWDYDEASSDDDQCVTSEKISSKTLEQWANMKGETYVLSSINRGEGWCKVTISISAVNP